MATAAGAPVATVRSTQSDPNGTRNVPNGAQSGQKNVQRVPNATNMAPKRHPNRTIMAFEASYLKIAVLRPPFGSFLALFGVVSRDLVRALQFWSRLFIFSGTQFKDNVSVHHKSFCHTYLGDFGPPFGLFTERGSSAALVSKPLSVSLSALPCVVS